ncbi:MAG: carboxylesterase family protein [Candidatus Hadarchaeales archaeon]
MKKEILVCATAVFFLLSSLQPLAGAPRSNGWTPSLLVSTRYGLVEGFEKDGVYVWLGIPYAKPPLGELRWKAPRDPEAWEGVLKATAFPPPPVQFAGIMGSIEVEKIRNHEVIGSENCLYLNIWRPKSGERLPVYVWIYGGANQAGQSALPLYHGANLARKANVVVVTLNYRVGIAGWFRHPALRTGNPLDDSGNYGLLDIVKALEWVHYNIENFGGDPNNVTVAGESAGAMNIYHLLVSPYVKQEYFDKGIKLFHRAVLESGALLPVPPELAEREAHGMLVRLLVREGWAENEEEAERMIAEMGAEGIANLLLSMPMENLYRCFVPDYMGSFSSGGIPFLSLLGLSGCLADGYVIASPIWKPYWRLMVGKYIKVPVIIGNTSEEVKFMLPFMVEPEKAMETMENAILGYPLSDNLEDYMDPLWHPIYQPVSDLLTSLWQLVGVEIPASLMRLHQKEVYVFKFSWNEEPKPFDFIVGACHSSEIPFIFGNVGPGDYCPPYSSPYFAYSPQNEKGRMKLSDAMIAYWSGFMRKGVPEAQGLPKWTPWTIKPKCPNRMVLDANEENLEVRMECSFATVEGLKALKDLLRDFPWENLADYLQELLGILGIDVRTWFGF